MDTKKYRTDHFLKIEDVREKPLEEQIAAVRDGQYEKLNVVFESGNILSVNQTNLERIQTAFGYESDEWLGKTVRVFLGSIKYQGSDRDAVLIEPLVIPPAKAKTAKNKAKADPELDDEVPF